MWQVAERPTGPIPRTGGRLGRVSQPAVVGLLVLAFIGGLAALAALVPVGHGFTPKGGGWFTPAVVGGAFTLHPLLVAVPWAACPASRMHDLETVPDAGTHRYRRESTSAHGPSTRCAT